PAEVGGHLSCKEYDYFVLSIVPIESPSIFAKPLVPSIFFISIPNTRPGTKNNIVIRNTAESISGDSWSIEPVSAFLKIPSGSNVATAIITRTTRADIFAHIKDVFSFLDRGSSSTDGPSYLPRRGIEIFFATK